ncbi:F-box domain containing protein [Ditylenchus destructor]|nr:F-box domain containing protein [Ditylenchus destructor]
MLRMDSTSWNRSDARRSSTSEESLFRNTVHKNSAMITKRGYSDASILDDDDSRNISLPKKLCSPIVRSVSCLFHWVKSFGTPRKITVSTKAQLSSMPAEVLHNIFHRLSAEDVSKLALTNHRLHSIAYKFILSPQHLKQFCDRANFYEKNNELDSLFYSFASEGRLMKTCCIFKSSAEATEFVIEFYLKTRNVLISDRGWALLFSKAFANFNRSNFFAFIQKIVKLDLTEIAAKVLTSVIKMNAEELIFRKKIFSLFLEGCSRGSMDFCFRLSALLHLLCPRGKEYRMLMILGAQIVKGQNGESDFIDDLSPQAVTVTDEDSVKTILGEIPELVCELLLSRHLEIPELRFSEIRIFNIIENITTYPSPWMLPNFAAFLLSSQQLARLAIYYRVSHDNPTEAGNILLCCIQMAVHLNRNAHDLLYTAAREVCSKCSPALCMTVFREVLSQMHLHSMEPFSSDDEVDFDSLLEILEVNKQASNLLHIVVPFMVASDNEE